MLRQYGGSPMFLVGIILFTAGNLFSLFTAGDAFTGFFSLVGIALPVIGFWIIFGASASPRSAGNIQPALTLFKVSVIIDLVIKCLAALAFLLAAVAFFIAASSEAGLAVLAAVSLLIACGIVLISVLYFASVMGVVGGIRRNLANNALNPLPRVNMFKALTYIGVGFAVLSSFIMLATADALDRTVWSFLSDIPPEYRSYFSDFIDIFDPGAMAASAFLTLIANAGIVLCVVTLSRLNNSLRGTYPPR